MANPLPLGSGAPAPTWLTVRATWKEPLCHFWKVLLMALHLILRQLRHRGLCLAQGHGTARVADVRRHLAPGLLLSWEATVPRLLQAAKQSWERPLTSALGYLQRPSYLWPGSEVVTPPAGDRDTWEEVAFVGARSSHAPSPFILAVLQLRLTQESWWSGADFRPLPSGPCLGPAHGSSTSGRFPGFPGHFLCWNLGPCGQRRAWPTSHHRDAL